MAFMKASRYGFHDSGLKGRPFAGATPAAAFLQAKPRRQVEGQAFQALTGHDTPVPAIPQYPFGWAARYCW